MRKTDKASITPLVPLYKPRSLPRRLMIQKSRTPARVRLLVFQADYMVGVTGTAP